MEKIYWWNQPAKYFGGTSLRNLKMSSNCLHKEIIIDVIPSFENS